MDQYLASIYDTNDTIQKIAAQERYENLYKLAEEEGVDLSGLTEEQLDELAAAQLGAVDETQQVEEEPIDVVKQAEANIELADYMGRIMAHSYTQERALIEKAAGLRDMASGVYNKIKSHFGKKSPKALLGAGEMMSENPGVIVRKALPGRGGSTVPKTKMDHVRDFGRTHKGKLMAGGAALGAAAGGGAYAASRNKEASANQGAFQEAALQRAAQILQEQGFDTSLLEQYVGQQDAELQAQEEAYMQQAMQQQQHEMQQQQHLQQMQQPQQMQQQPSAEAIKMANDMMQAQFQQALDEAAWDLLAQSGYPIEDGQEQMQQPQMQSQMGQQFAQ